MLFCSQCGAGSLLFSTPDGDHLPRHICQACNHVFYQNPHIICGTLPIVGEQILLCKRAIDPRLGYWTLPAGFMENGETLVEAAARETWEEAEAVIEHASLYTLFNLPEIHQVHAFFLGSIKDGAFGVGAESLAVQLFHPDDLPWDTLAFPTVTRCLQLYLKDRLTHHYPVRIEDLRKPPR